MSSSNHENALYCPVVLRDLRSQMCRIINALSALILLAYNWNESAVAKHRNAKRSLDSVIRTNSGNYHTAVKNEQLTRDTLSVVTGLHEFALGNINELRLEFNTLSQAIDIARSTRSTLPEMVAREWVPCIGMYKLDATTIYDQAQPAEGDIHGMIYYRAMTEYLAALKACEAVFYRC